MGKEWLYTDIHTHIIPGVDDGAADMKESLKMAEAAYAEGIRVMIATPHYGRRNPGYETRKMLRAWKELRERAGKECPGLRIYPGNELYYSPGIIRELEARRALTLGNTDYVLAEFAVDAPYRELESAVREFVQEGYRPVLAHIERYQCLYRDPERVEALSEQGACMQVNARGFLLRKRDRRGAWCRELLTEGLVDFVASDCHGMRERKPVMKTAVGEMARIAGEEETARIVGANIRKLSRNKYI